MLSFLLLAFGQSVELPATIRAQVGTFILIKPVRLEGGKAVRYFTPDGGLSVFPNELLNDATCSVLVAAREGRYKVFAVTAVADKISPVASTVIIVGDSQPDVVPPDPDKPKPPKPPDDITKDPIYQQLVGIVGGLGEEKKSLPKLASIYEEAGGLSDCVDMAALNAAIRNIRDKSGIGQGAMTVRESLAGILEKELGTDPAAKVPAGASDLFKRIAKILRRLSDV